MNTPAIHTRVIEYDGDRVRAQLFDSRRMIGEISVSATVQLDRSPTPWVAAALPVAMRLDAPLHVDGTVDETLLGHTPAITGLLSQWHRPLHPVPVTADSATRTEPTATGVGCFFSGGVDSFYSVFSLRERITHLIFVHGFDIAVEETAVAARAMAANREIARLLGIELIEVTTDIRRMSNRWADWGLVYHGAALALVGLLLSPVLHEVVIPSSWYLGELRPWGSHPALDPLWSTGAVRFVHHGVEARRTDKIAAIADSDIAMDHLRVCWQNRDGSYNCGRCEKCVRTVLNLHAVGARGRCTTLPSDISPDHLRGMRLSRNGQTHARENLHRIQAGTGSDPGLQAALAVAIRRGDIYGPVETAKERARQLLAKAVRR